MAERQTTRQFINHTYLFLESEGDATDWTLLNALHKVTGVTSNLVSEFLGLDDCNVVDDSLVDMEISGEPKNQTLDQRAFEHDIAQRSITYLP